MALSLAAFPTYAQLLTTSCGGNGDSACSALTTEFWANDSGSCDRGLKSSVNSAKALAGNGVCENDNRSTRADHGAWVQWALDQQRRYIGGNVPLNRNLTLGTHNSYSNYADGDDDLLSTNQGYSLTDQLNLGARHLRLDPVYYFGEYRLCHTNSDNRTCGAIAALEYAPLATVLAPLLPGINVLVPPPIPEVVDAGLAGTAIYSAATSHKDGIAVNNRLFVSAIREIADWLKLHPTEFITVGLNFADGQEASIGPDITKIISNYMVNANGEPIVYTGDDFAKNNMVWPSLNDLQHMTPPRQIAFGTDQALSFEPLKTRSWTIYQSQNGCNSADNAQGTCDITEMPGITTSGHNPSLPLHNPNFYSCALSGFTDPSFPIADFFTYYPNGSIRTSEGRTGSDYAGPDFTGLVNENEVVTATTCGYSSIDFDFFMSLGQAFGPYATSNPDKRREAAIWSWEENDYGTAGVAAMDLTIPASTNPNPTTIVQGRWKGVSVLAHYAFACADKSTSKTYPKTWTVVRGAPNMDYYDGVLACGTERVFSYPENAMDNHALLKAALAMQPPVDYVFLATGANGLVPPAATSAESPIDLYMDQGGPVPDPTSIAVDGERNLSFYPVQDPQKNDPTYLLNLGKLGSPGNPIPLEAGPVNLLMAVQPQIAETLPAGSSSGGEFTVDLYDTSSGTPTYQPYPEGVTPATGSVSLHVLIPTTTTLSSTPQTAGSTSYILRAEVEPTCPQPNSDNPRITGVMNFTDTYYAPGEKVRVTQLGWTPINSSPSIETTDSSQLPIVECADGTAPDNVVCVGVTLPPGRHSISAQYHYDSLYNSSASNADEFTTGSVQVSPQAMLFDLRDANVSLTRTLTYRIVGPDPGSVSVLPGDGSLLISGSGANYQITLKPDPSWIPGLHSSYLKVVAAGNSMQIPVDIIVPGTLSVSQSAITLASVNQAVPTAQTITVSYEGGPIQAVSPDAPWLSLQVEPSAVTGRQSTTAQIIVGADPSGLPDGTSFGTILISQPGSDNITPVKVTLEETITAPTITVTTNPSDLNFVCNRTTYTAPHTFINPATPFYCEGATTVQTLATGTRALFGGWSDGYPDVVRTMDARANQTFTILYRLQNEVSIAVNPTCAGTVVPSHFWYNPGTLATSLAKPEGNFKFVGYSGDLSFSDPALKFSVSGPVNLVANFKCTNCDTLTSQPAAISLGNHLSLNAHVASGNPADRIQFIVDPDLPPWLSVSASSSTIPTNLTIKADVSALEAGSHNTSITIHPVNLPAGASVPDLNIPVTLGLVDVVVDSVPSGLNVIVDNVTYTAPAQFKWVSGSDHRLNAATQIVGNAKYVPGAWSDGGAAFHVVTAPVPGATVTYTDNFATYYQLALKANPPAGGNLSVVNPAPDGFYPDGGSVSVRATANPGFRFAEFSGSVSASANPVSLNVNNYVLEFANFNSATGPALRVTSPSQWLILPLSNTVSGIFQIANVSTSGVGNVTVSGVDALKTVAGTGTVSLISRGPVYIAAFPPGASFPFQMQFNWPASAQQIEMTVHFAGNDGAYVGQTTLTLTR